MGLGLGRSRLNFGFTRTVYKGLRGLWVHKVSKRNAVFCCSVTWLQSIRFAESCFACKLNLVLCSLVNATLDQHYKASIFIMSSLFWSFLTHFCAFCKHCECMFIFKTRYTYNKKKFNISQVRFIEFTQSICQWRLTTNTTTQHFPVEILLYSSAGKLIVYTSPEKTKCLLTECLKFRNVCALPKKTTFGQNQLWEETDCEASLKRHTVTAGKSRAGLWTEQQSYSNSSVLGGQVEQGLLFKTYFTSRRLKKKKKQAWKWLYLLRKEEIRF